MSKPRKLAGIKWDPWSRDTESLRKAFENLQTPSKMAALACLEPKMDARGNVESWGIFHNAHWYGELLARRRASRKPSEVHDSLEAVETACQALQGAFRNEEVSRLFRSASTQLGIETCPDSALLAALADLERMAGWIKSKSIGHWAPGAGFKSFAEGIQRRVPIEAELMLAIQRALAVRGFGNDSVWEIARAIHVWALGISDEEVPYNWGKKSIEDAREHWI